MSNQGNPFSAALSALGYLFQCRYALLESLRQLRKGEEFSVSLETLDDVVFEFQNGSSAILQLKHHLKKVADLTDASPDLWKTLRIWCEGLSRGTIPGSSIFFLVTTASASEGSAAHYLRPNSMRNPEKALERLNATASSSTNETNKLAYAAFRAMNPDQKRKLLDFIFLVDAIPTITNLDDELRELLFFAVEHNFMDLFLQRLEGWWYRRVIGNLTATDPKPILSEEINTETTSLREQFKQDNLPIDDDIMRQSVDASGYQERVFVQQLRLIEISNPRIFHAIRNYFRAFEQRSRWVREDLLHIGELDRYEDRLVEEWDILFQQMRDDLGMDASEDSKKRAAQALYKWVETNTHVSIRPGVIEPSIARGSYHILSDSQRVGWHTEFKERLQQLLEPEEATQ